MILETLRTQTAAAHRALEEEVRIDEAARDPGLYRSLLERFFGFHEPMDARLSAFAGWETWEYVPSDRKKHPWLISDLRALGLGDEQIARLPICTKLPAVNTLAEGFGCAYVLEGSTLGGRHISKMLQEAPREPLPMRFFTSYGADVGKRWKEFCAALEAFVEANPNSSAAVVRAAEETFTCFRQWMR